MEYSALSPHYRPKHRKLLALDTTRHCGGLLILYDETSLLDNGRGVETWLDGTRTYPLSLLYGSQWLDLDPRL